MDAKTPPPPIPLKLPEKARAKKHERLADLSLPPLSFRQNGKSVSNLWTRHSTHPTCYQNLTNKKKRPYRVLQIGATPLMHACQQADRSRVLRLLREQEETIGYRDRTLRSALHYCMDAGTGGAVASAAPELVNAPDAEGHTPLHLAVIAGDTQLVAVLLANGADVNAKDLEGHSVLHWATVCGEAECVRLILAAGARPSTADLRGGSPLHYAAQCCGAAANAAVLAVPKKLGLKILRTLLEFGADVNAKDEDGRQPILWAASAGSVEAVLALARAGGAAAAGASDKDGLTALHCAASRGHVGCIEALVNLCGSQPDHVDDNGCSALHYAATLGHADATSLILRLGADPNRQDRKGRTPALCAAAKGQLETLKILAQHGGSLHARTVRGTGVAHEAVTSGRIELLEWLIKKRPSTLDVATQDGKTPLHVAALHGHLDACKMLLDHGARINAILRTSKGNAMTALDAALYRGHRDCAKLIQMHGGTTAQRLRIHKIIPNKVFSTKLRIKHTTESSTDMESSSPRRRGYDCGYRRGSPRVCYEEERWIEKRTHRRGNSKKLSRRDSRSFSEEEIRSSKASLRKERQLRTRSESARYDDHEDGSYTDEKFTRKERKKRTSRSKDDYSETSVGYSDESSQDIEEKREDGTIKTTYLRRKFGRRRRSKCRAHKGTISKNGMRDRENCSRLEMRNVKEDHSGSDDSLEVIVVKTREKVIKSGEEKSKTPREVSDTIVSARKRISERKKSKSPGSAVASADKEKLVAPRWTTTSNNNAGSSEKKKEKEAQYDVAVIERDVMSFARDRYHRDATDSTSHETVERVLVTAMVHKDGQCPDTPKSTTMGDISKEAAVLADAPENEITSEPDDSTRKVNDAYKNKSSPDDADDADAESSFANSLLSKIGLELLHRRDVESNEGGETKSAGEEVAKEGRLRVLQVKESRRTSVDSTTDGGTEFHKDFSLSKDKQKDDGQSNPEASPTVTLEKIVTTASNDGGSISNRELLMNKSSRSIERDMAATPFGVKKAAVSKVKSDEKKEAAEELATTARKEDVEGKGNAVYTEGGLPLEEALTECVIKVAVEDRELVEVDDCDSTYKEGLPEASEYGTESSSLFLIARVSDDDDRIVEDKEQVDSARGKSVDLSSDCRDSASTIREGDVGSSRMDTPVCTKGGVSEERSTTECKVTRRRSNSREIVQAGTTTADSFANNDEIAISIKDDASTPNVSPRRSRRSRRCRSKNQGALANIWMNAANKGSLASQKSCNKNSRLLDDKKSRKHSTDRGAIVAVIEAPGWEEEEEDEEIEREIRKAIGEDVDRDTEPEEESNNEAGIVRVLPSTTSEEESYRRDNETCDAITTLPEVRDRPCMHSRKVHSPSKERRLGPRRKHRRDNNGGGGGGGGRDSGIEPSPRVSRIPKRRCLINYPNTEKHEALDICDTVTRDVQISMRRYHLERKIFFQLMELKRLQIRHGRANEQVLVKRQVESFHKAGMSGPTLGVAKYDQPLTFRHFEAFLYEQLRKLQRRPATPSFCTDAKHCTRKTHRCHHATTAYTSVPVYTYRGDVQERGDVFPKIETRGKGRMTVEVSHGDQKRVIALPAEKLDCTKRYFVTFTVTGGESQAMTTTTTTTTTSTTTEPMSSHSTKRCAAKSV